MQKIAFIRALISDVEILLLDESTANLDDKSRDLILIYCKIKKLQLLTQHMIQINLKKLITISILI